MSIVMKIYIYRIFVLGVVLLLNISGYSQTLHKIVSFTPPYVSIPAEGGAVTVTFHTSDFYDPYELYDFIRSPYSHDNWGGDLSFYLISALYNHGEILIHCAPNEGKTFRVGGINFGNAYLHIIQPPNRSINLYKVSGGGEVATRLGVDIHLSGSQSGVSYRLKMGTTTKRTLAGTGKALIFRNISEEGVYKVEAYQSGKTRMMEGAAKVIVTRENCIVEVTPLQAMHSASKNTNGDYSTNKQLVNKIYYDGLGRLKQQVALNASTSGKDVISPVKYDTHGRNSKQYLPYTVDGGGNFRYICWQWLRRINAGT
jgi:hypothetical protein